MTCIITYNFVFLAEALDGLFDGLPALLSDIVRAREAVVELHFPSQGRRHVRFLLKAVVGVDSSLAVTCRVPTNPQFCFVLVFSYTSLLIFHVLGCFDVRRFL